MGLRSQAFSFVRDHGRSLARTSPDKTTASFRCLGSHVRGKGRYLRCLARYLRCLGSKVSATAATFDVSGRRFDVLANTFDVPANTFDVSGRRCLRRRLPSMSRVEGVCDGGYLRCLGSKIFENPSTGRVLTRSGAFWGSMPGPGLSGGPGVPIVGSKPHGSCLPCRIPKSGGPALSSQSTSRSSMRSGTIHRRFGSSRHSALLDRSRAGTPSSSQRSVTRSVQPKQSP